MVNLRKKRVDATVERNLVAGCIVSTRFCKELLNVVRTEYLQSDYSKIVVGWVKEFFAEHEEAPGKEIQNIFVVEGAELEEDKEEVIKEFLSELSQYYTAQESFNESYHLDRSLDYIRRQSLKLHTEKVRTLLELGNVEEAEAEIGNFRKIARQTSQWVNPFTDEFIEQTLIRQEENFLFQLPGVFGEMVGKLKRGHLVSLMGPMKRGKTWWLMEFAFASVTSRRKTCLVSLEMDDDQVANRAYKMLTGMPDINSGNTVVFPIFDCLRNQEGSCTLKACPKQPPLLVKNAEGAPIRPPFTLDSRHEVCTVCRGDAKLRNFVPTVWYTSEQRPEMSIRLLKRRVRSFSTMYGNNNLRIISYPIGSANLRKLQADLDLLEYTENFVPDHIAIDYADLLGPEDSRLYGRDAINETWKGMKALAQSRHCLVTTATQANRESIDRKSVRATNTGEDIRKLAHVDLMAVLNQTPTEKRQGIMRVGLVGHRHEFFDELQQVQILQELRLGQPHLDAELLREIYGEEEGEGNG